MGSYFEADLSVACVVSHERYCDISRVIMIHRAPATPQNVYVFICELSPSHDLQSPSARFCAKLPNSSHPFVGRYIHGITQ